MLDSGGVTNGEASRKNPKLQFVDSAPVVMVDKSVKAVVSFKQMVVEEKLLLFIGFTVTITEINFPTQVSLAVSQVILSGNSRRSFWVSLQLALLKLQLASKNKSYSIGDVWVTTQFTLSLKNGFDSVLLQLVLKENTTQNTEILISTTVLPSKTSDVVCS